MHAETCKMRRHLLLRSWHAGAGHKLLHPVASACPRPGCGLPAAPEASPPAPHAPCCCAVPAPAAAEAARCFLRLPGPAAWPAISIKAVCMCGKYWFMLLSGWLQMYCMARGPLIPCNNSFQWTPVRGLLMLHACHQPCGRMICMFPMAPCQGQVTSG